MMKGYWIPAATASPTGTDPSGADSTPPVPVAPGVSSQSVDPSRQLLAAPPAAPGASSTTDGAVSAPPAAMVSAPHAVRARTSRRGAAVRTRGWRR